MGIDSKAGYYSFFSSRDLGSYSRVCACFDTGFVDSLHHIVVFVGKKFSEIEKSKSATGENNLSAK
ncbi:hypothetical protein [Bartonella vinsonii]|uniref:hypothetical protein n=1 Tax=Bartonella vinsonii TaxID=33047 RepID=UPI0018C8C206|nr:hypothetical protein [Bartonella vinsonii]